MEFVSTKSLHMYGSSAQITLIANPGPVNQIYIYISLIQFIPFCISTEWSLIYKELKLSQIDFLAIILFEKC